MSSSFLSSVWRLRGKSFQFTDKVTSLNTTTRRTPNYLSLTLESFAGRAKPQAEVPLSLEIEAPEMDAIDSPVTFAELGIMPELVKALAEGGITSPFPVQALTIPDALAGRDVCGKARTGSGKTLAFGLPMLHRISTAKKRRPHALVLVPTRELANQVAEEIAPLAGALGFWVTAIYGGSSMVRQVRALHAGVEIVIATPGRLNDLLERKELSLADINTVVIDEADQMADMGFLPQVRQILDQMDNPHQTLLFSATLDGSIGDLVRAYQTDPVRHEVVEENTTADNMDQRFIGSGRWEKLGVAASICRASKRSIVFVRTRHGADRLAEQLVKEGVKASPIHGGLTQGRRERTLSDFSSGRSPVLVATNVAARGIHVDGVDTVLHFDLPEDGKTYLHRSGRTARAGSGGLVVTLVAPDEAHDARALQREAGINVAVVSMKPDDERLNDLAGWEPPLVTPEPVRVAQQQGAPTATYRKPFRRTNNNNRAPQHQERRNDGPAGAQRGPAPRQATAGERSNRWR